MVVIMREFQPMIDRLEQKDLYTQGHSHHVFVVAKAIYGCLPKEWVAQVNEDDFLAAALLHDIGKEQIPDSILKKEGALTPSEWAIMRRHPEYGCDTLRDQGYAKLAQWVRYHHERVDGKGYYGLAEEQIPFASKIIAVADTFSALRTYRIYRDARSIEDTVRILTEGRGTQLDAGIVDAFLELGAEALSILECDCIICRKRRAEMGVQTSGAV